MAESLVLFESVINSRWFLRTSIILFLNKIDVFKAKLPKVLTTMSLPSLIYDLLISFLQVHLDKYFPEYTGGTDVNKGAKYILWRFMQANRARLNVYPQFVNSHIFSLQWLTSMYMQYHPSHRHVQHQTSLCHRERDNSTECSQGVGYPMIPCTVTSCTLFRSCFFISFCGLDTNRSIVGASHFLPT